MSGPKSSRYTLSAEQLRKILEEQERIKRELEEKAKKERECKEAQAILDGILQNTKRHIASVRKVDNQAQNLTGAFRNKIADDFLRFYATADRLIALASGNMTDHSELMSARRKAEQHFAELIQFQNQLTVEVRDLCAQEAIQNASAIADAMNVSFAGGGLIEEKIDPIAAETMDMLNQLLDEPLPQVLHVDIDTAIACIQKMKDHASIANYAAITAASLRKQVKAYQAFRRISGEQFDALQDRYRGLCVRLGEPQNDYPQTETGMAELERKVHQMEYQMNYDAQQAYISHSLDEVMREMGYQVIGSRHVTKKSGKSFTSKLLAYDDGAVVNVTEASNGQITMEIGSTDEIDRTPNANERVALRKKMERFCTDFKEIEKRLADRGDILDSRLVMAPPEEMYAQIINLSDFELVDDYRYGVKKHQTEVSKTQQAKVRNE